MFKICVQNKMELFKQVVEILPPERYWLLQRQSAVTNYTNKETERKRSLKFLYQPVKHVMGRLCGNASPKQDII